MRLENIIPKLYVENFLGLAQILLKENIIGNWVYMCSL